MVVVKISKYHDAVLGAFWGAVFIILYGVYRHSWERLAHFVFELLILLFSDSDPCREVFKTEVFLPVGGGPDGSIIGGEILMLDECWDVK